MANTYSSLFYHIVFSTKFRKQFILPYIEKRVWSYLGGAARKYGMNAVQIGGIEDHIHALILSRPKYSVSEIAKFLKRDSSKWFRQELGNRMFGWQDGYSAFSVSKSSVPKVVHYIREQRKHHSNLSFEDEYTDLLRLHDIDVIDESYRLTSPVFECR